MSKTLDHTSLLRRAVIDSGPLMDLLTLQWASKSRIRPSTPLDTLSSYLQRDVEKRGRFEKFVEAVPSLLTTSHVIGELQRLSKKLSGSYQREFWTSTMEYLEELKYEERLITFKDTSRDRLPIREIGPTDCGLIRLATLECCSLLTNDRRLKGKAQSIANIDGRLMEEVVGT